MTLERLRPVTDALLRPMVKASITLGLGPHALSIIGFLLAVGGAASFILGSELRWWYLTATLFVALSGVFDLLDGAVAREQGIASDSGDVLDHTLDRYADIVLVGGMALAVDQLLIGFLAVTGVLMTSYLGTQAQAVDFGRLYAGFLGRADRLALIGFVGVLMTASSDPIMGFTAIGWLLLLFAFIGHLTAVQRFVVLWRGLS